MPSSLANTQCILVDCIRTVCGARAIALTDHCDASMRAQDKIAISARPGASEVQHDLHRRPDMVTRVPTAGRCRSNLASFERYGNLALGLGYFIGHGSAHGPHVYDLRLQVLLAIAKPPGGNQDDRST